MATSTTSLCRSERWGRRIKYSDFIIGTANTVGVNQVELRVQDGTALTKKDIRNIPEAFERFFANAQQISVAGFQVSG
jgi:hypothetical protein